MSKPCWSGKAQSPDVCGAVDVLRMGGEEQQGLELMALLMWEQSSDLRDISGVFFSVCPGAAGRKL